MNVKRLHLPGQIHPLTLRVFLNLMSTKLDEFGFSAADGQNFIKFAGFGGSTCSSFSVVSSPIALEFSFIDIKYSVAEKMPYF